MSATSEPSPVTRRGRASKRQAIMVAARAVFSRDGYARASIDQIAAQAGVSTRTIYHHFSGKEHLFCALLTESAGEVAEAFVKRAEAAVSGTDLNGDLIALGSALAAHRLDFPEHFALVRQISAEAPHFPPELTQDWFQVGPQRVELEVARCLRQLADRGALRLTDPGRAAKHFIAITMAEITHKPFAGEPALTEQQITDTITAAVNAFIHGYGSPE